MQPASASPARMPGVPIFLLYYSYSGRSNAACRNALAGKHIQRAGVGVGLLEEHMFPFGLRRAIKPHHEPRLIHGEPPRLLRRQPDAIDQALERMSHAHG